MAWTQEATGSTTVGTGESTLTTETTNGTYVFIYRINSLALGDEFVFRVRAKVLTGDASGGSVLHEWYVRNPQQEPAHISVPFVNRYQIEVRAQKIAGTDRTVDWEVWST